VLIKTPKEQYLAKKAQDEDSEKVLDELDEKLMREKHARVEKE
jgi:hypothetical protein